MAGLIKTGIEIAENLVGTVKHATAAVQKTAELTETTVTTVDNTVKILEQAAVQSQKITEATGEFATETLKQGKNITAASGEFTATNIDNAKKIFTTATESANIVLKGTAENADSAFKITNTILNTGDQLIKSTSQTLDHITSISNSISNNGSEIANIAGKFTTSITSLLATPITKLSDYNDRINTQNTAVNNAQERNKIINNIKDNVEQKLLENIKETNLAYIKLLNSLNTSYYGTIKIIENMGNCKHGLTRLYHFFTNQECNYIDYDKDIIRFKSIHTKHINIINNSNILDDLNYKFKTGINKISIITQGKNLETIDAELQNKYEIIKIGIIREAENTMGKQIKVITDNLDIINEFNNNINNIEEFEKINSKLEDIVNNDENTPLATAEIINNNNNENSQVVGDKDYNDSPELGGKRTRKNKKKSKNKRKIKEKNIQTVEKNL